MLGRTVELPQVLRSLHPANQFQPRLPVRALICHDSVRMAAAAVNAHELPAWCDNEPGCVINFLLDLVLDFLCNARYREQRGNAERDEAALQGHAGQDITRTAMRWQALFR